MLDAVTKSPLLRNPEFQSALIRLAIWVFAIIYIGLGAASSYYAVELSQYYWFFSIFFFIFILILISIFFRPVWEARRYFSLFSDIAATSFCILMTNEAINPFYMLYIWLFISYGTRYGKQHLRVASVTSFFSYLAVLVYLDQWHRSAFDSIFFLALLLILPLYQYSLLNRLHQARVEAERSSRAKSTFLSTMTHELRTPLNGIVGMSHLLRGTPLSRDQKEYVNSITSSAAMLNSLIGNVLDLTKMESSRLELDEINFSLRPVVRDVCVAMAEKGAEKGVAVLCEFEPRVPRKVRGDPTRLKQILFNLLDNAIKFTGRGQVEVRVLVGQPDRELSQTHIRIEIQDSGVGIREKDWNRVFDSFWQADSSTTQNQGGTGLGATIARNLAQVMGGVVGLSSQPGAGALFYLKLPLLIADASMETGTAGGFDGVRGLVVELNPTARDQLVAMCKRQGVQCRVAARIADISAQVIEAEEEEGLDFILVADTPEGQDVERLAAIVRHHLGINLPVIYLGYGDRRVHDLRPNTVFLAKPITDEVLVGALKSVLDGVKAEAVGPSGVESGQVNDADIKGLKILMAEDNPINAKVLSTLLGELGCEVFWAKDGQEALEASSNGFDMAFVDLRMPRLDGVGFARGYRSLEGVGEHMPIIALTANTSAEVRHQCLEAGMDDFLSKPVDRGTLGSVLRYHLDRAPDPA